MALPPIDSRERDAMIQLFSAYHTLETHGGWREMAHAPKDGTEIEYVTPTSSGIHEAVWIEYDGAERDGDWFCHEGGSKDGDTYHDTPVLWRPKRT